MKKYWKYIVLVLTISAFILFFMMSTKERQAFDALKENRVAAARYVEEHYVVSVFVFGAALISTAFFIPGALIMTVAGGFFFGAAIGALYAGLFLTIGATLAFLLSRHLIGGWVQNQYRNQLKRLNEEISRHGQNYLFILRIIPVLPFFLVNYLAGVTRISLSRFVVVTFCGMCPGSVVYSIAGRQLQAIEDPKDILSPKMIIGFSLLAFFALMPVLFGRIQRHRGRKKKNHFHPE